MRSAVVLEADRDRLREAVLDVLRREGTHVVEATHTHARFRDWSPQGQTGFARDGYVGLHPHAGEKDVDLRVFVRATWPRRALVWASAVGLATALLLLAVQPRPVWWIASAAVLWPAWVAALVFDVTAREASRAAEARLLDDLVAELRQRGLTVLTEPEVRRQDFERRLEGELAERRLKENRKTRSVPEGNRPGTGKTS